MGSKTPRRNDHKIPAETPSPSKMIDIFGSLKAGERQQLLKQLREYDEEQDAISNISKKDAEMMVDAKFRAMKDSVLKKVDGLVKMLRSVKGRLDMLETEHQSVSAKMSTINTSELAGSVRRNSADSSSCMDCVLDQCKLHKRV